MALHGDVRVNGRQVGCWSARRTEPLANTHDLYTYECYAEFYDLDGRQQRHTFKVQHVYAAGAMSLGAKVLDAAATLGQMGAYTHG